MSDTPRTDAEEQEACDDAATTVQEGGRWSTPKGWNFARQLERENAKLRESMQSAIDEISWFVSRQKDLMGDNGEGRPWSAVLDEDLNILRNALANKVAA